MDIFYNNKDAKNNSASMRVGAYILFFVGGKQSFLNNRGY